MLDLGEHRRLAVVKRAVVLNDEKRAQYSLQPHPPRADCLS